MVEASLADGLSVGLVEVDGGRGDALELESSIWLEDEVDDVDSASGDDDDDDGSDNDDGDEDASDV